MTAAGSGREAGVRAPESLVPLAPEIRELAGWWALHAGVRPRVELGPDRLLVANRIREYRVP